MHNCKLIELYIGKIKAILRMHPETFTECVSSRLIVILAALCQYRRYQGETYDLCTQFFQLPFNVPERNAREGGSIRTPYLHREKSVE